MVGIFAGLHHVRLHKMPRFLWCLVLMVSGAVLLAACEQRSSNFPTLAKTDGVERQVPALLSQPVPLTSGSASLSCDYDYQARTDRQVPSIDIEEIRILVRNCINAGSSMVHLYYKGAIGNELKSLMVALNLVLSDEGIRVRILEIDSPGGDVDASISAGEELSNGNWAVWVKHDARCFSACVLILAAGTNRSISGSVGIHRMLNPKSQARTPAELQAELDSHLRSVKNYLTRYGANPALADLMMTVPSRELRVLNQQELSQFGLDGQNPVKADLVRLDVTRRCGHEFVRRWDELRQANKTCPIPRAGTPAAEGARNSDACMNRNYDRLGFPDPKCPDDGPRRLPSQ